MKLGFSTYCMESELREGRMTVTDLLEWASDHQCGHVELVPYGYTLVDNAELADRIRDKAASLGIVLSNYAMPANFCQPSEAEFQEEVRRVMKHVDVLRRMGIRSMRHDVTAFTIPAEQASLGQFLDWLPQIVKGSRIIADYAAQFGITTHIENHGWSVQHSERVRHVLRAVDRPNFKAVLDIGNFMCVDENPLAGIDRCLPFASIVHVKDFYVRPFYADPGEGRWFRSVNGNYLRGSIFGHGDLPVREALKRIKSSGYDGFVTLEFEGMEDNRQATAIGLRNVRRLWEEA